jgi:hypothetical protein
MNAALSPVKRRVRTEINLNVWRPILPCIAREFNIPFALHGDASTLTRDAHSSFPITIPG